MRLFAIAYLAGAAWLLGWELAAFAVNHKYTISDLWWELEGHGWTAARYFTLAALVFLTGHIVFRLFR